MYNFIVLAPNDWKGQRMNRQQLFSLIAKKHNVIYSTGPAFNWDIQTSKFKIAKTLPTVDIIENVKVLIPGKFPLRVPKIPLLDNVSKRMFCAKLEKLKEEKHKNILYLFNPKFIDYKDYISHNQLVYHAYDDYSKWEGYDTVTAQKEKELLKVADLVFTSSKTIKERLETISDRSDIVFLPNGVDYCHFSKPKLYAPADLNHIPYPRIGYVGSINKKVDLTLLKNLALTFKKCSFVMVGPIGQLDKQGHKALDALFSFDNVYFLGNKDPNDLPSYMHNFSINIMLYKTNGDTWAPSCYPLKLHEYLAVGRPVISPDIEAVREFSDVIIIPKCFNDWVDNIEQTLSYSDPSVMTKKRQNTAAQNTWEIRVQLLLNEIKKLKF